MRTLENRTCPIDPTDYCEVIDVRSPDEFAEDHVPGAINLPVLDNAQRARIGTIYKQKSAFEARKEGAALVAANISRMLDTHFADFGSDYHPLVYCWRGGQRSQSLATILLSVGWRTSLLTGGYQIYRRDVIEHLEEKIPKLDLRVINGVTGSGKTDLLKMLKLQGAQVLDLEGLANHRGSLLGNCGAQPAQRLFETKVCEAIRGFSTEQPVFLEAESSRVGNLYSPVTLWKQMKEAPVIELDVPRGVRVDYLVKGYRHLCENPVYLLECLHKLRERVGSKQIVEWEDLIQADNWAGLVESLLVKHYDPSYLNGKYFQNISERLVLTEITEASMEQAANKLLSSVLASV